MDPRCVNSYIFENEKANADYIINKKRSNWCTRKSEIAEYLNEVGEILACVAAYPTVE